MLPLRLVAKDNYSEMSCFRFDNISENESEFNTLNTLQVDLEICASLIIQSGSADFSERRIQEIL